MSKANVKALIDAIVKENHEGEITGTNLNEVLTAILNETGGGGGGGSVDVIDNLNSDSATDALSAKQGKVLNQSKVSLTGTQTITGYKTFVNGLGLAEGIGLSASLGYPFSILVEDEDYMDSVVYNYVSIVADIDGIVFYKMRATSSVFAELPTIIYIKEGDYVEFHPYEEDGDYYVPISLSQIYNPSFDIKGKDVNVFVDDVETPIKANLDKIVLKADKMTTHTHPVETSIDLIANCYNELDGALDGELIEFSNGTSKTDEYILKFSTIGEPIIVWNNVASWVGGEPTIEANKTYLVSIQDGIGIIVEV